MPLTAVRHVRKMRGGAQAHLLEADDGKWYVVKFRNNPQHRRVLVNEVLGCQSGKHEDGSAGDLRQVCMDRLKLSSRAKAELTK